MFLVGRDWCHRRRRRLEFDFVDGSVTLFEGGVLRSTERRFPVSAVRATIIHHEEMPSHLSVVAVQPHGLADTNLWPKGESMFWDARVTAARERDLQGLFRALPDGTGQTPALRMPAQPSP